MKFSIIIPVYNYAHYLSEAVGSALAQTIPSEVIIVNDGSTDNSLEVAQSYESRGVKVINQVNKGLPSARNTGIMNATSDFILFLDADDILLGDCIEKIIEGIKRWEEKFNNYPDIIAPSFKEFGTRDREVILLGTPLIKDFTTANRLGYFSAIKKSVLLEVGGYSPKMAKGYEDYHLWFDILKRGHKVLTLQDILVLYRVKENSMLVEAQKYHHEELMAQIKKDHPEAWIEII